MAPLAGHLDPDQGTETESGDGQSRDQPLFVREPLNTDGDRDNIGDANTSTTNDTNANKLCKKCTAEKATEAKNGYNLACILPLNTKFSFYRVSEPVTH